MKALSAHSTDSVFFSPSCPSLHCLPSCLHKTEMCTVPRLCHENSIHEHGSDSGTALIFDVAFFIPQNHCCALLMPVVITVCCLICLFVMVHKIYSDCVLIIGIDVSQSVSAQSQYKWCVCVFVRIWSDH